MPKIMGRFGFDEMEFVPADAETDMPKLKSAMLSFDGEGIARVLNFFDGGEPSIEGFTGREIPSDIIEDVSAIYGIAYEDVVPSIAETLVHLAEEEEMCRNLWEVNGDMDGKALIVLSDGEHFMWYVEDVDGDIEKARELADGYMAQDRFVPNGFEPSMYRAFIDYPTIEEDILDIRNR